MSAHSTEITTWQPPSSLPPAAAEPTIEVASWDPPSNLSTLPPLRPCPPPLPVIPPSALPTEVSPLLCSASVAEHHLDASTELYMRRQLTEGRTVRDCSNWLANVDLVYQSIENNPQAILALARAIGGMR